MGRQIIQNPLNEMWITAILEIQPLGDGEYEIVWEWHMWDHLVQDISTDYPNYGVISEHPELWNINNGNVGGFHGFPHADWVHCNCVTYNPDLDLILITSRNFDEIYILDHSTSIEEAAGHTGGNYGQGGDILYRWGNPLVYNTGSESDVKMDGPHAGVWVPAGYPGEGNILIFNNRFTPVISAVYEIIPPMDEADEFIQIAGEPFGPMDPVWTYTDTFFSPIQSGAFRQPNGNTLITSSTDKLIIEVEPDGDVVWLHQYDLNFAGSISRAVKYAPDYLIPDTDILLGDINEDGMLDILDIVSMVGIILGTQPDHPAADMNVDGNIDILDVVTLVNIILA